MKFFGVLLVLAVTGVSLAGDIGVVEEIVAKVNSEIVTRGELEHTRKQMIADSKTSGLAGVQLQEALAAREKDILRDRIDELLLTQRGKDLNINVDSEVSKWMAEIQSQNKIADPEKFQEFVKQQTGMPFEDFKSETKNQMLRTRVIRQEVGGHMNVKKEDVQKYYEEHKSEFVREERVFLREILISTDKKDAAGIALAEKKAKDLTARARKGEKFPELARDNSDALTAKSMGELGPVKKGEMLQSLEDLVWNQPKGYVTDPIRVDNGFLILKVDDHQKAGQAELSDVENEIMDKLYAPRMQPALRAYLTKLRADAFLEIKPGYIDTGAAAGKNTAWSDPAQLKPETVTKSEVSTKTKHKKLLWAVPIPGTNTGAKGQTSSSR